MNTDKGEYMESSELEELINRRRRQILVHSSIYYLYHTSLVDDATYDGWSIELAELQKKHPEIAEICIHKDDFKGFDGSTGYDLPYQLPSIRHVAQRLLISAGYDI